MEKQIAVVICNYNGGKYLIRCVESLIGSNRSDCDIFVVDNASTDDSVKSVKKRYPQVIVLQNKENLGGAGGFQTGFQHVLEMGYPYIMPMDNDACVEKDTMTLLYEYLRDNPDTGIAAAKIMCLDEPDKVLDYGGKLDYSNLTVRLDWWMKTDSAEAEQVRDTDFAPTTASMITKKALEYSGGMDPEYFIYLDDIEMSQRIKRSGFKVVSVGYARAWHKSGLSQEGIPTTFKQYYFNRNRYYFFSRFAEENEIDQVAENIIKDTWTTMRQASKDGYPAVYNTARYALEDFLDDIRGKAKTGRISKKRYVSQFAKEIDINDLNEYLFFRDIYKSKVLERISILRCDMKKNEEDKEIKVAVVIPVYNTKKYLRKCIDSVQDQTLKELEIICVDDGSTDGSAEILDEYAKRDPRIIVIHKENEGYGKAVNEGIDRVTAPYFGIVESDDYIDRDMYLTIYETMQRTHADVIKADYYNVYEREGRMIKKYVSLNTSGGEDLYRQSLDPKSNPELLLYGKYTWSGLYRTDFVRNNSIRHNETPGAAYQDNGFWFQTMIKAKNVYFIDEAFYCYRQDNADASFYNKGNAMAELDEFRFAETKLEEMGDAGSCFRGWMSFLLLSNGYYSFHRVDRKYKEIVAERVRDEFLRLSVKGSIDYDLFSNEMIKELFFMISNPGKAARRDADLWDSFFGKLISFKRYVVYGAGKWANRVLIKMQNERLHQRVVCFAVSNLEGNPEAIEDIPVRLFSKDMVDKDMLFIIAIKNSDGVEDVLREAGVKNIIYSRDLNLL